MNCLPRPVFSPPAQCELELQLHPASSCPVVRSVRVTLLSVDTKHGKSLHLRYTVTGKIRQLKLPAPVSAPGPADDLWRHTCCEFFVAELGAKSYREFNFSPSGQWAIYCFADERIHDAEALKALEAIAPPPPLVSFQQTEDEFILEAALPWAAWGLNGSVGPVRAGLTAVIEAQDGSLSYWALHHPANKPDFHDKAGWTKNLNT